MVSMIPLMAFCAGALVVAGAYSVLSDLYLRDRSRISSRIDDAFREQQQDQVRRSQLFRDLGRMAADAAAEEPQPTWQQRLEASLEQSGLRWSVARLWLTSILAGAVLGLAALLYWRSFVMAAVAFVLGGVVPFIYVLHRRKARNQKLLAQLPDAFDLMARVIRAGQTIPPALRSVADEFDPPIAQEFSYCYEQQNLGLDIEIAIRDLARRTGLLEIRIFAMALVIQQQTGGNLAELLDKLAGLVRERFRVKGKIRTLTAEGRLQALVLLALPPCLLMIVLMLNRTYASVLVEHWGLLVIMGVAELLGLLWIRRIVNFDF